MKRWLLVGILIVVGVVATPFVANAAVNDFRISTYAIDYYLNKDAENRSTLKTVEKITAEFPQTDQNHGIERAIPKSYDGHTTSLSISSVTDEKGGPLPYSTYDSNDNLVVRIGDKDTYVHGSQTYIITYEQRDVTRFFANIQRDEFYWDTNGTEWKVPINQLSVRVHFADGITSSLTIEGKACYRGASGSTERCDITKLPDDTYGAEVRSLSPGENVTLAFGFAPETFAVYQPSLIEKLLGYYIASLFIVGALGVAIIIWLSAKWYVWSDRKKELGTIIPEYLPPKDTSVTTAASIGTNAGSVFTAQLLDFAVRHYTKIYQTKEKSFFKAAEYEIEIIKDISSLKAEEQEILNDIYGKRTAVGSRLALKTLQNNTSVYNRMQDNDTELKKLVRGDYGLRHRDTAKQTRFKRAGWIILGLSVVTLNPVLLIAAITSFVLGYTLWPLTDKGLVLSRYLMGLKEYIKVAEVDRLKMLQSPEGAEKVGSVDVNEGAQLVKLYERVLPYAVLFNQEKEWTKRIGDYYASANTSPDWYSGHAVFNAAVFSSAISNFSTAASYSSASSSSSGGSSGGGSSGGGGGGGGGGGW